MSPTRRFLIGSVAVAMAACGVVSSNSETGAGGGSSSSGGGGSQGGATGGGSGLGPQVAVDGGVKPSASVRGFPASVAVASPLAVYVKTGSGKVGTRRDGLEADDTSFAGQTAKLKALLEATDAKACVADVSTFFRGGRAPLCYGPSISFTGHPDGTPANNTLPPGDLGMWAEIDPGDGSACAAATLNQKMIATSHMMFGSLQLGALLVCASNTKSVALPSNSTSNLSGTMTEFAAQLAQGHVTAVSFEKADVSHSDAGTFDEYAYAVDMTLTRDDATPAAVPVAVRLTHRVISKTRSTGRLTFQYNTDSNGGNCPVTGGGSTSPMTIAGSLLYAVDESGKLSLDARDSAFCGHDANPFKDGLLDPASGYDPATRPHGWGNNFNRFVATFEPATGLGDYAYAWQAGQFDDATRVFNVTLGTAGDGTGQAYFGFGQPIATWTGGIDGFICNWAGPGNSHARTPLLQAQRVEREATSGRYLPAESHLTYDPVKACESSAASFSYERFVGGTLTPVTADTTTENLIPLADYQGAFTPPTAPTNF